MHCAGNADVRTPNLDRLAAGGTRFDNFFCASPVCSPARASILTGTIPSAHGVQDWLRGGNVDAALPEVQGNSLFASEEKPIQYLAGLTCYTDLLAEEGYTCALSGKWHLGDSLTPQHGFSHWYTIARGGCWYMHPDMVKDGKICFEDRYVTDLITEDALAELEELSAQENPFYLSVHYTAPHSPWDQSEHPKEFWDLYEDCRFEATPDLPLHPWQVASAPCGTGEKRKQLLRGYYSAISAMDAGIGRILDRLEEKGLTENTLVIFSGDNGMNMGHHGIWGKGNGTFPQNMFDTSVKVPFILSWPGHIQEGAVCSALLSHYDILPTLREFLELGGAVRQKLPGKSFADILRGQKTDQAEGSIVIFDEYGPVRMIRNRRYKYIHRYPYGPDEFYDLEKDPNEEQNLIDSPAYQAQIIQMKSEMEQWFYQYVDPAIDGAREGVTGSGQLRRVGIYAEGKPAHAKLER